MGDGTLTLVTTITLVEAQCEEQAKDITRSKFGLSRATGD